jgi:RNA polymerase sigma-70 factor (ECF subfamily)
MAIGNPPDISGLLIDWSQGNEEALKDLISAVYPEVRLIARRHLARRGFTLQSVDLANEAYLKLMRVSGVQCECRGHFFALCAQIIRRLLVDHARKHKYAKRGGDAVFVPLNEELLGTRGRGVEILALDDAMVSLSNIDPRKGRVVELRFFGGLTVDETAEVLRVSPETVLRDWKMAKAWLSRELNK